MEDLGSVSSNKCTHCNQEIPAGQCDAPECPGAQEVTTKVTQEVASEAGACQKCGAISGSCTDPECVAVLAHEETTYVCQVCEREVAAGEMCDRPDCPRVAVEQIRKASIDTPFKLGL